MRPKIIAANWKMNQNFDEGIQLASELVEKLSKPAQHTVQIILLVPFIHLEMIGKLLPTKGTIHLGAQNCHNHASGAFTGEIAAPMLQSVGVKFVLLGHSERRQYCSESNTLLAKKVTTALQFGLRPIFCCGESQKTRAAGQHESFVSEQLVESLFHLSKEQIIQTIIAYEPMWAIGTGNTPMPDQVQGMHKAIRHTIAHQYGEAIAQHIPILYGGSCNEKNAPTRFACPDVDGGLIGKASLEAASLVAIVNTLL